MCSVTLTRGDRREVIHVDRWRMLVPATMVECGYAMEEAISLGREALEAAYSLRVAEVVPPDPKGEAGLDKALADAKRQPASPEKDRRGRSRSRRKKGDMGEFLKGQAEMRAADESARKAEKKKKKRRKEKRRNKSSDSEKKNKKHRGKASGRRLNSSSGSGGGGDSSSSESTALFRSTPARGGDLVQVAQKKPGLLLKEGLKEMSKFLAERDESTEDAEKWKGRRVMSYVSQVLLNHHPMSKIGIRSYREVITVGNAVDLLLQGRLPECGDLLIQRLKALETSFQEGTWSSARHQELIPAVGASMTSQPEREVTAKAELRAQKLRLALQKSTK